MVGNIFEEAALMAEDTKPSEPTEMELALESVLARHGAMQEDRAHAWANQLDIYCTDAVLEEIFPGSKDPSHAELMEKMGEFDAAYRQKLKDYRDGKFDLPHPDEGADFKPAP